MCFWLTPVTAAFDECRWYENKYLHFDSFSPRRAVFSGCNYTLRVISTERPMLPRSNAHKILFKANIIIYWFFEVPFDIWTIYDKKHAKMSYYGPVKHLRLDKDKNEISLYSQNDQNCLLKGFAAVYVRALFYWLDRISSLDSGEKFSIARNVFMTLTQSLDSAERIKSVALVACNGVIRKKKWQ